MTIQAPPSLSKERSWRQAARDVDVERLSIDTIRTLAMDMVEASAWGHADTPMVLAPLAYVLFTRYLKHDPADPDWADRDRFVLTAGHPERGVTPGVASTGPLGQSIANAVGMALTEHLLAARFNRPGHEIIDHRTWVIASDGDLMEGVGGEACSLAGHLGLGKLVVFYDDNRITGEGCSTPLAFSESVGRRFEAYGWQVLTVGDVNDADSLAWAIETARGDVVRPSLVVVRSTIACEVPTKQGTATARGMPLGPSEIDAAKKQLGCPYRQPFVAPAVVRMAMDRVRARAERRREEWDVELLRYQQDRPDLAAELERVLADVRT